MVAFDMEVMTTTVNGKVMTTLTDFKQGVHKVNHATCHQAIISARAGIWLPMSLRWFPTNDRSGSGFAYALKPNIEVFIY